MKFHRNDNKMVIKSQVLIRNKTKGTVRKSRGRASYAIFGVTRSKTAMKKVLKERTGHTLYIQPTIQSPIKFLNRARSETI